MPFGWSVSAAARSKLAHTCAQKLVSAVMARILMVRRRSASEFPSTQRVVSTLRAFARGAARAHSSRVSANIHDVSDADFGALVIERSRERPVVVDFWAPWCGPCRVLGPVLEREVDALAGRVLLAKLNTDESPATAGRYAISSIPAVKAFRDGEVVAEFIGARDAGFVRSWLAVLAPSPARQALAAAVRSRDEAALAALVADPDAERDVGLEARTALARLLVDRGAAEAEPLLDELDDESAAPLRSRLAFHRDARSYGGEERARTAVTRGPDDLEARWALASALAARGEVPAALDELLEIV